MLALISVLGLSYILAPKDFGEYSLIVTNSLLIQLFLGSWITSSANKFISKSSLLDVHEAFSTILFVLLLSLISLLICSVMLFLYFQNFSTLIISIFAFSCSIIVYDVALSVLNSTEQAKEYAKLSISRAMLATLAPVSVALAGGTAWEIAIVAAIATLVSLIFSEPLRALCWQISRPNNLLAQIRLYVSSGVAGAIVLGIYILLNSPLRNLVAFYDGADSAGHWALTSDIFYGPLAIAGSVATLSANRQLHRWNASASTSDKLDPSTWYINMLILVALPYAAGGFLLGSDLAHLIFSKEVAIKCAPLVSQFCIQNSAILVIYGLCHVAFTREKFLVLYCSIAFVSAFSFILAAVVLSLEFEPSTVIYVVAFGTVLCALFMLFIFTLKDIVRIDYIYIIKTCILTIFMTAVIMFIKVNMTNTMAVISSIFAGLIFFAGGAFLFGMLRFRISV